MFVTLAVVVGGGVLEAGDSPWRLARALRSVTVSQNACRANRERTWYQALIIRSDKLLGLPWMSLTPAPARLASGVEDRDAYSGHYGFLPYLVPSCVCRFG